MGIWPRRTARYLVLDGVVAANPYGGRWETALALAFSEAEKNRGFFYRRGIREERVSVSTPCSVPWRETSQESRSWRRQEVHLVHLCRRRGHRAAAVGASEQSRSSGPSVNRRPNHRISWSVAVDVSHTGHAQSGHGTPVTRKIGTRLATVTVGIARCHGAGLQRDPMVGAGDSPPPSRRAPSPLTSSSRSRLREPPVTPSELVVLPRGACLCCQAPTRETRRDLSRGSACLLEGAALEVPGPRPRSAAAASHPGARSRHACRDTQAWCDGAVVGVWI
jgi:hypothetical protein